MAKTEFQRPRVAMVKVTVSREALPRVSPKSDMTTNENACVVQGEECGTQQLFGLLGDRPWLNNIGWQSVKCQRTRVLEMSEMHSKLK